MSARLRLALPHAVMLVVAGVLYAIASRIDSPAAASGRIGPDFWPKVVIAFMGVLAAYEVVRRLWFGSGPDAPGPAAAAGAPAQASAPAQPRDAAPDPAGAPPAAGPIDRRMLLAGSALILGFVLAVDWLGFFVSTVVFLWGFMHVGGFRRSGWNLVVSTAGGLLTLVLFMRLAYISLPLGAGPFKALSLELLRLIGVS